MKFNFMFQGVLFFKTVYTPLFIYKFFAMSLKNSTSFIENETPIGSSLKMYGSKFHNTNFYIILLIIYVIK
jgi:hypothetical protein